MSAHIL